MLKKGWRIMTKDECLAFLDRAKELEMALPDDGYIIGLAIRANIQVGGEFDFRKFAESYGARVRSEFYKDSDILCGNHIHLYADLFGCEVCKILTERFSSDYKQELRLCGFAQ